MESSIVSVLVGVLQKRQRDKERACRAPHCDQPLHLVAGSAAGPPAPLACGLAAVWFSLSKTSRPFGPRLPTMIPTAPDMECPLPAHQPLSLELCEVCAGLGRVFVGAVVRAPRFNQDRRGQPCFHIDCEPCFLYLSWLVEHVGEFRHEHVKCVLF